MEKFNNKQFFSAVVLPRINVDTDAIMPKFALKKVDATGYGEYFFDELRFKDKGSLDKKPTDRVINDDFELNAFEKKFGQKPELLIVWYNFGCGSSREHAVYGVRQYGIKVIISFSDGDKAAFADIFKNNSAQNGLLLVELSKENVEKIAKSCLDSHNSNIEYIINVDLENQCIYVDGEKFGFSISERAKQKLLNGLDDSDEIIANWQSDITAYEEKIKTAMPFLLESTI